MQKHFEKLVSHFLILVVGLGLGYAWCFYHTPIYIKYTYELCSEAEAELSRLRLKHGRVNTLVVFEDPLGEYFIRDSKRITLN